jgi:hypothetical protein
MGLINDILEDSLPGVAIGALATAILVPLVGGRTAAGNGSAGTATRGRGRPLLKAAVRGYVSVADRIKEATAEAREQLSDLAAEVREERRMQAEAEEDATTESEPAARPKARGAGARRHPSSHKSS